MGVRESKIQLKLQQGTSQKMDDHSESFLGFYIVEKEKKTINNPDFY